jgi:hypothetical protein
MKRYRNRGQKLNEFQREPISRINIQSNMDYI